MTKTTSLFSLEGKTALVTGGYRGLGRSIAEGLAESGATVFINGRSKQGVEAAVAQLRGAGHHAQSAVFDINDEVAVDEAAKQMLRGRACVDILVNNAGIHRRNPLLQMPLEDFRAVLDTNLTAAFTVAKRLVVPMIENGGGKIINMCSLMSDLARPTTGNYAAAKGGLRMLTRAMAAEWAPSNVQVNAIAPGYFVTELTQGLVDDPQFNRWICGRTPTGRWGQPDELKGVGVFLASEASHYVNGQMIAVDGGLTAVI